MNIAKFRGDQSKKTPCSMPTGGPTSRPTGRTYSRSTGKPTIRPTSQLTTRPTSSLPPVQTALQVYCCSRRRDTLTPRSRPALLLTSAVHTFQTPQATTRRQSWFAPKPAEHGGWRDGWAAGGHCTKPTIYSFMFPTANLAISIFALN